MLNYCTIIHIGVNDHCSYTYSLDKPWRYLEGCDYLSYNQSKPVKTDKAPSVVRAIYRGVIFDVIYTHLQGCYIHIHIHIKVHRAALYNKWKL